MNPLWSNLFKRPDGVDEIEALLRDCFLFQDLSKKEIHFLRQLVHVRNYKAGESVFRQGEIGVGMYILARGTVDILVEDMLSDTEDMAHVTRLQKGDFFGEQALVEDNSRRSANAVAVEGATAVGFFKPDLEEILERNPSTGAKVVFRLAQILGRRLKATSDKVTELKKQLKSLTQTQ